MIPDRNLKIDKNFQNDFLGFTINHQVIYDAVIEVND